MNYRHLGGLLLLGTIGCVFNNTAEVPNVVEPSQSAAVVTEAPASSKSETPGATEASPEASAIAPDGLDARTERDYAPTAPLPATGQVTVRGSIREIDTDRMIAECPTDSAPYAFAESTNYFIQICSAEFDPWLPKYYMSQAKDGSGGLELTNPNPDTARQLIFPNGDYTYILYRDSARPEQTNAYLEVYSPDGSVQAEALIYFYEQGDRP